MPKLRFTLDRVPARRELTANERASYVALQKKWAKKLKRVSRAVENSERLTAEDYAARINARW